MSNNDIDFSEWAWGNKTTAISEAAAYRVLHEIVTDWHLQFSHEKGKSTVIFYAIDFQIGLETSLVEMTQQWIEDRGSSIIDDDDCRAEAVKLVADLQNCAEMLLVAMKELK